MINKFLTLEYAFFDVDGTVTAENNLLKFLYYCLWHYSTSKKIKIKNLFKYYFYQFQLKVFYRKKSREFLNQLYYKNYKQLNIKKIFLLGLEWFNQEIEKNKNFFNKTVLREINRHKKENRMIVFVSGSFLPCLKPIADYLGADKILCSQLKIIKNNYSGEIERPPIIGTGKVTAIIKWLNIKSPDIKKPEIKWPIKANLKKSYAYGDHISDINMLALVGHAYVISKNQNLIKYAQQVGWTILDTS